MAYSYGDRTVRLDIDGMEELIDSLEGLMNKYPDRAGEFLRADAKALRKEIVQRMTEDTHTDKSSKRSLGRAGSYYISPVQGYGSRQSVDIGARSPHFHLVERGHELYQHQPHGNGNGSKKHNAAAKKKKREYKHLGFVQGKHSLREAVKAHEEGIEATVLAMVDELLREEDLL